MIKNAKRQSCNIGRHPPPKAARHGDSLWFALNSEGQCPVSWTCECQVSLANWVLSRGCEEKHDSWIQAYAAGADEVDDGVTEEEGATGTQDVVAVAAAPTCPPGHGFSWPTVT